MWGDVKGGAQPNVESIAIAGAPNGVSTTRILSAAANQENWPSRRGKPQLQSAGRHE